MDHESFLYVLRSWVRCRICEPFSKFVNLSSFNGSSPDLLGQPGFPSSILDLSLLDNTCLIRANGMDYHLHVACHEHHIWHRDRQVQPTTRSANHFTAVAAFLTIRYPEHKLRWTTSWT